MFRCLFFCIYTVLLFAYFTVYPIVVLKFRCIYFFSIVYMRCLFYLDLYSSYGCINPILPLSIIASSSSSSSSSDDPAVNKPPSFTSCPTISGQIQAGQRTTSAKVTWDDPKATDPEGDSITYVTSPKWK